MLKVEWSANSPTEKDNKGQKQSLGTKPPIEHSPSWGLRYASQSLQSSDLEASQSKNRQPRQGSNKAIQLEKSDEQKQLDYRLNEEIIN